MYVATTAKTLRLGFSKLFKVTFSFKTQNVFTPGASFVEWNAQELKA